MSMADRAPEEILEAVIASEKALEVYLPRMAILSYMTLHEEVAARRNMLAPSIRDLHRRLRSLFYPSSQFRGDLLRSWKDLLGREAWEFVTRRQIGPEEEVGFLEALLRRHPTVKDADRDVRWVREFHMSMRNKLRDPRALDPERTMTPSPHESAAELAAKLTGTETRALSACHEAQDRCKSLRGATDRAIFDWIQANLDKVQRPQLDEFESYSRTLRQARRKLGLQKYTPRGGRTGRSITRSDGASSRGSSSCDDSDDEADE